MNPVIFGFQDCESGHDFGPAVRTCYLIHFVVSGFGHYTIGGKEYKVNPGEMFVIPPYEEIYYKADDKNPWDYIWIGFTTEGELPLKLNEVIRCPEAYTIFNQMKTCCEFSSGRSAYLSARLWDLFALLLSDENHRPDYVEKALACMHSEYMFGITVEEIARRLSLDRSYFSTLFKKKVGTSPKQYLLNYRMNMAASLLIENDISISVAASSVGYTDVFNFSLCYL